MTRQLSFSLCMVNASHLPGISKAAAVACLQISSSSSGKKKKYNSNNNNNNKIEERAVVASYPFVFCWELFGKLPAIIFVFLSIVLIAFFKIWSYFIPFFNLSFNCYILFLQPEPLTHICRGNTLESARSQHAWSHLSLKINTAWRSRFFSSLFK